MSFQGRNAPFRRLKGAVFRTCIVNTQVFFDRSSDSVLRRSELLLLISMVVLALPLVGAALAPAVPGVKAWHASRSLGYLRSSTITLNQVRRPSLHKQGRNSSSVRLGLSRAIREGNLGGVACMAQVAGRSAEHAHTAL